ncbi:CDP-glucose 4,6-dehydratase [bacterium]|nr:CDP-glucose 4,6-dehydratase [bacterium]
MRWPFNDIYNTRRILLTGNTGFKGSWLSLWLYELGADVIGYALEPPTKPNLFETLRLGEKITSITNDIRNLATLRDTFEKYQPEIVFHMAAQSLVRYSYKKPVETYETNVMGTANLLEACRQTPSVQVIIIVTSDKCYANLDPSCACKESDPMGGYDPYSSSKGCAELITAAYLKSYFNPEDYERHHVSLASVRAGNAIGGGDWGDDRLIPDCIKALSSGKRITIRNPDAVRPWQHVLEPLYGYLLVGQRLYQEGPAFSGAWNFGPDECEIKPVKWIVEEITRMWGVHESETSWICDRGFQPHEAHCLKLDCSKAKSKIGWFPKWDLKTALEKTIKWYKAYYANEDMLPITINQIKDYETHLSYRFIKRNETARRGFLDKTLMPIDIAIEDENQRQGSRFSDADDKTPMNPRFTKGDKNTQKDFSDEKGIHKEIKDAL